jgi:hypothetical protein
VVGWGNAVDAGPAAGLKAAGNLGGVLEPFPSGLPVLLIVHNASCTCPMGRGLDMHMEAYHCHSACPRPTLPSLMSPRPQV